MTPAPAPLPLPRSAPDPPRPRRCRRGRARSPSRAATLRGRRPSPTRPSLSELQTRAGLAGPAVVDACLRCVAYRQNVLLVTMQWFSLSRLDRERHPPGHDGPELPRDGIVFPFLDLDPLQVTAPARLFVSCVVATGGRLGGGSAPTLGVRLGVAAPPRVFFAPSPQGTGGGNEGLPGPSAPERLGRVRRRPGPPFRNCTTA